MKENSIRTICFPSLYVRFFNMNSVNVDHNMFPNVKRDQITMSLIIITTSV